MLWASIKGIPKKDQPFEPPPPKKEDGDGQVKGGGKRGK
jgi:hypothetical protein